MFYKIELKFKYCNFIIRYVPLFLKIRMYYLCVVTQAFRNKTAKDYKKNW